MRCHDCPLDAGDRYRCAKCRAARAQSNVRWRAKVYVALVTARKCIERCGADALPDARRCETCRVAHKARVEMARAAADRRAA